MKIKPVLQWLSIKNEKKFDKPTLKTSTVLINGKLATCIILSIVSAFIDIVFFSGLSRSDYPFFSIAVPAAIILSIMSIGFSFGKFFVAMQINVLKELQTRLYAAGYNFAKSFNKPKLKWNIIHKFLISISIITSMSLSVITIGNGVREIEQSITNMSTDANDLLELQRSISQASKDRSATAKSNITGRQVALQTSRDEVDRWYDLLVRYQSQYRDISDNTDLSDEDKKLQQDEVIAKIVREIPGATRRNALYFTKADLQKSIQATAQSLEVDTEGLSAYEDSIAYDTEEVKNKILAIADKEYKNPDGTLLKFLDDDGNPINISMAIGRLQASIMKWQSDTGDAGPSSKMFSLLAIYLHADTTAGGLGVSEIIMMSLIFIFGVVQEFLIAILTPKGSIDRKTLSQFSEYIDWSVFDVNRFLLKTYKDQYDIGILSTKEFEAKAKKCVELLQTTNESIIERFSKKEKTAKPKNDKLEEKLNKITETNKNTIKNSQYSSKVTDAINEIENILKDY